MIHLPGGLPLTALIDKRYRCDVDFGVCLASRVSGFGGGKFQLIIRRGRTIDESIESMIGDGDVRGLWIDNHG